MTSQSVPSRQNHTRQTAFNWRRHSEAAIKPAFFVLVVTFAGTSVFLTALARLMLNARHASVDVASDWYMFAVGSSALVSAVSCVSSYFVFRNEYIELGRVDNEQTYTDYKSVPASAERGERLMTKDDNGSILIGRHRFSHRQRRMLARALKVGDNVSHELLHQVGFGGGDIKAHTNRKLYNDIQSELIRLGYCVKSGKLTKLSEKGARELLEHPPTRE